MDQAVLEPLLEFFQDARMEDDFRDSTQFRPNVANEDVGEGMGISNSEAFFRCGFGFREYLEVGG
jgi:hypothetical protein